MGITTPTDELTRLREECARLETLLEQADAVIADFLRAADALNRHRARQNAREDSSQAGAGNGS